MVELLRKDLIAARWFLLPVLALYVVQLLGMSSVPPLAALTAVGFTLLLVFGPLGIDEAQQTETLWNSLPVSRGQVVVARYALSLVGALTGFGIYQLASSPPPALNGLLFAWVMLQVALFLPCYFRLGLGKGVLAYLALALALSVLGSAFGALLARSLDVAPPDDSTRAALEARLPALAIGASLAIAPLLAVSALVSVAFYRRRDL